MRQHTGSRAGGFGHTEPVLRSVALAVLVATGCSRAAEEPTTGSSEGGPATTTSSATTSMASDDAAVSSESANASSTTAVASTEGDATAESTTTGAPDPGVPMVEPTDGTFVFDPRVGLSGVGSLHVGEIDLVDGFGTVVVDGESLPALVHHEQPFGEWTLYQALAVAPNGWTLLWFYCRDAELTDVYLEGTSGLQLEYEGAKGVCAIEPGPVEVAVQFPASELAIVDHADPFAIDGPELSVANGQLGTATIGGQDWVVAPFETVDCTACGGAGWYEVHAVLWDPMGERACFSILYLRGPGATGEDVQITYALSLPDLDDPIGNVVLDATWQFGER
jgi:hypothetical protein